MFDDISEALEDFCVQHSRLYMKNKAPYRLAEYHLEHTRPISTCNNTGLKYQKCLNEREPLLTANSCYHPYHNITLCPTNIPNMSIIH